MFLIIAIVIVFILCIVKIYKDVKVKTKADIENAIQTAFTGTKGGQPYAKVYGYNLETGPCAVTINTCPEMAVVVIVRYDNLDGNVAGHLFIESDSSGLICLPTGTFQVFLYSGRDWNPKKEMDCGLYGGFTKDEIFQQLSLPHTFSEGENLTYTLRLVQNSDFDPVSVDKDLFF